MHYNLNERQNIKKPLPYKKIGVICVLLLAALAVYVVVFHHAAPPAPVPE